MKTKALYSILLMMSFSLMSFTCSDDDDGNNQDNSQEIALIQTTVESGDWIVTSYIDSGTDETNDFNGYTFTFGTNGSLTATNGNTTYNGNWSVTDSNSNDDSPDSDIDFNISFPVPDDHDFDDLNDDWDIINHSNNMISLRDVSGGDGSVDTLIFERN
ncbi:hypothetical protein [Winogradskyella sp.]|uniref:hypothetical protein n=1 Tax=Winogradskyella sp. TaxID=1883156 RepID=UPI003AA86065